MHATIQLRSTPRATTAAAATAGGGCGGGCGGGGGGATAVRLNSGEPAATTAVAATAAVEVGAGVVGERRSTFRRDRITVGRRRVVGQVVVPCVCFSCCCCCCCYCCCCCRCTVEDRGVRRRRSFGRSGFRPLFLNPPLCCQTQGVERPRCSPPSSLLPLLLPSLSTERLGAVRGNGGRERARIRRQD